MIIIKFYIKQLINFVIFHKEERNPSEINTYDFLSYEMGECSLQYIKKKDFYVRDCKIFSMSNCSNL